MLSQHRVIWDLLVIPLEIKLYSESQPKQEFHFLIFAAVTSSLSTTVKYACSLFVYRRLLAVVCTNTFPLVVLSLEEFASTVPNPKLRGGPRFRYKPSHWGRNHL